MKTYRVQKRAQVRLAEPLRLGEEAVQVEPLALCAPETSDGHPVTSEVEYKGKLALWVVVALRHALSAPARQVQAPRLERTVQHLDTKKTGVIHVVRKCVGVRVCGLDAQLAALVHSNFFGDLAELTRIKKLPLQNPVQGVLCTHHTARLLAL